MQKGRERFTVYIIIVLVFCFGALLSRPEGVRTEETGFRFTALDVGQGDASLVRSSNGHYVLIDGGPDKAILKRLGEEMNPDEKVISAVILTHAHADHLSGLIYVLNRFKVDHIYLNAFEASSPDYVALAGQIKKMNIGYTFVSENRELLVDDVTFRLFPAKGETPDLNDHSIVTEIFSAGCSALVLGDLSGAIQDSLGEHLHDIDVLRVSHHGSRDGVSKLLLSAVKPEFSVISVGKNSYGHPHMDALDAYYSVSQVMRTDESGSIPFYCAEGNLQLLQ